MLCLSSFNQYSLWHIAASKQFPSADLHYTADDVDLNATLSLRYCLFILEVLSI